MKTMAQGDNVTETFLEKDIKNDNVPDASDNSVDIKLNNENLDNTSGKDIELLPPEEVFQEHSAEVSPPSGEKGQSKSKPIKLKRKKLEECHKVLDSADIQNSMTKEEQKRKWGECHSRSRSRSSENDNVYIGDKKKRATDQRKTRNARDDKTPKDVDMKDENVESGAKHLDRHQHLDSDSSSDTDKQKGTKRKMRRKRSESSSSDSSSSSSNSSSSDSDHTKSLGNKSSKRKRLDIEKTKTRSSSTESQSSDKHEKEKTNTSDSSDSHTASHRWEKQRKNQTETNSETKLESSHHKSHGNKVSRKSPSPRKNDQKRSFNSQKTHSKDSSRKTSPRDKRASKESKLSNSPNIETEEHGKQCPIEKDKERAAKISRRKLSLSSRKDDQSNSISERPIGKRRWGSSTKTISKPSLSISTDSLKDLIPDYKPIVKNVVLSNDELSTAVSAPEEECYVQQEVKTQLTDLIGTEDIPTAESVDAKADSQKDEIARPPTPPQNPPSCVLHIRNLVRPFTLHQLKEFLKRTGTLVEGGFWIDKIKSKCYVTYETQEQAMETRHALHGTRWPVSNPKTLTVDFATKEELDFHKELPDVSKLQAKKEKPEDKKNSSTSSSNMRKFDDEKRRERGDRTAPPIREWDRDKLTQDSPEHDWSKEKTRDRGRSPDRRERKDKKDAKRKQDEETPAKLLDDLFRKTKAAPCIYWLPLTEEQIQLRVQVLRQRRLEREKRRQLRDQEEKDKEEAERQQRQKTREGRSGKEKENSQQSSRSPSGRKR